MSEDVKVPEAPQKTSDVVTVNTDNMDAFNAERLGLPIEKAPEPIEPTDDPQPEEESTPEPEPEEEPKAEKPKKKNSFQERISELTAKEKAAIAKYEAAEAEKAELRRQLEEAKQKTNPEPEPQPQPDNAKPKQEDFQNWDDYVEALSDWKVEQKFKEREAKQAQETAQQEWQRKVNEAKKELPDYDEVMALHGDMKFTGAVLAAIQESDIGPQIAHHLVTNPDVAERINKLSLPRQAAEIGRIEASLAKPATTPAKPTAQVSKAPEPITPIRSNTTTMENKVDADGNFHGTPDEWRELRKAGKIK